MTSPLKPAAHVVCLTPVRNEAWIIKPFVAAAAEWANRVIVLDQVSTDGTRELLQAYESVDLICNDDTTYDEAFRQKTLINRARATVPEKRILLALDADEFLSANYRESAEWQRILDAAPGTVLRFRWVNVQPGFEKAWIPENRIACGFVDDGAEHQPRRIHSTRIPCPEGAPVLDLEEIVILHLQFISEERMQSKHRWYQAWERLNDLQRSALDIFRQYNHRLGSWKTGELQAVRPEWIEGFAGRGIDLKSIQSEPITWWDLEMLDRLAEHGPGFFRRMAIWDTDWQAMARQVGRIDTDIADPRSWIEKAAHRFLASTQGHRENWLVRGGEKLLRLLGW